MKVNYEKAIEVNNEIKLIVDEQQYDDKFKEQGDIEDEDEVQEITATITPMKKKKPVCDMQSNICNKKWIEKHIQE